MPGTSEERAEAIFGAFDGATSLLGLLAGMLIAQAAPHTVLQVSASTAAAAAVSMGFGERVKGASWRVALVMGVATLAGALVPALPAALLPSPTGYVVSGGLCLALGGVIAEARYLDPVDPHNTRRGVYGLTFLLLAVAAAVAVAVALVLGAAP